MTPSHDSRLSRPAPPQGRRTAFKLCLLSAALLSGLWPPPARAQSTITVVSAANYAARVAQEAIVSGFGSGMASAALGATSTPLPTTLGGTTVKVRDAAGVERDAPLFYVSPTQINFQIPPGTAAGVASVAVKLNGATAATGAVEVAAVAPGVFTADSSGKGLAAANVLRVRNGAQTYEPMVRYDAGLGQMVAVPIDMGVETDQVFLLLYGTGFRKRNMSAPVACTVGGVAAEVTYAGEQPQFVGLDQINVKLPRAAASGREVDIALTVDGQAANTVRVALRAVAANEGALYLAVMRPEGTANSPASGSSTLKLSADEKSAVIKFSFANLTTPQTSGHLHGPADPGANGGILFDLDDAPKQADGSYLWTFQNVGATTAAQIVAAIKAGRVYINIHSSRYPSGEIRGHYNATSGSQEFTPPPNPPALPTGKPTAKDAARFLAQATFGPKPAEITDVQNRGFEAWLDEQFTLSADSHLTYLDAALAAKGKDLYQEEMMESFWKQAVTGRDQLRQRVGFALQQIFVVSFNSNINDQPFAVGSYVDMLNRNAFGNFRQLLEDVTLHPAMGRYLDHIQNDKEDPVTGQNPNENYARELLQLFSIGLYKLHPDGSLRLDANGLPIATYDQETVKGFSKVFTGWSYGTFQLTENNWKWPPIWQNGTAFWRVPMQVWPNHHSTAPKKLLDGVTLPGGQSAQQDLKAALDNIFNHSNVGPFIARQLIQRLVTSNPSPGYVYRVAQKFNDNGGGVRGDMRAVVRAVLLDYEARGADVVANQGYGKMREPVVRFAHLLRAFNYSCPCGKFPIYWMDSQEWAIGQNPLRSPTVFNFFEPNYSHPGQIAAAGLYAPEFQITNDTSVIGISTFFHYVVRDGFRWEETKPLVPDYAAYVPYATNPTQLVDHLDLVMAAGGMTAGFKTSLVNAISAMPTSDPTARVKAAVHLILTSPDYVIQK
jgi:uncharacterized protein (TIGR03437 family)